MQDGLGINLHNYITKVLFFSFFYSIALIDLHEHRIRFTRFPNIQIVRKTCVTKRNIDYLFELITQEFP